MSVSLRVESLRLTSFAKKELPEKVASDTYLSRVKYWHVASLGLKLFKAGNNKSADM